MNEIYNADCLEKMQNMEAGSVDSIVCDPPYGLDFMGKEWDHGVPGVEFWRQALKCVPPGGHMLAFGGTRTHHRLMCAIEDAGWELRDTICWRYGSGFPKSHNVGKAVDEKLGNERARLGKGRSGKPETHTTHEMGKQAQKGKNTFGGEYSITKGNTKWEGWGTALKPAWEPIIMARKPLDGTVAENVLEYQIGGLNIDGTRIGYDIEEEDTRRQKGGHQNKYVGGNDYENYDIENQQDRLKGRFPANLIHDGSEEVEACFPKTKSGKYTSRKRQRNKGWCNSSPGEGVEAIDNYGDSGSASRYFKRIKYCAKASKAERNAGQVENNHPTVKPVDLLRYLCKLITPPAGTVLDPFMGSGTTGMGAILEGFNFIGIEKEQEYCDIARKRIDWISKTGEDFIEADKQERELQNSEQEKLF